MAEPDRLEARVAALETQARQLADRVGRSEHDAAAARVLAGGADRDVTEIRDDIRDFRRATTSSFNAMREDLTDLREDLTELREDLTDLREDLTDLRQQTSNGFIEMRGKFDAASAGQQQIVDLLNTLITQQQGDQPNDQ